MQKKKFSNFGADSLDCGSNLDNLGINFQVRTTVLNYTVFKTIAICGIVSIPQMCIQVSESLAKIFCRIL